MQKWTRESRYLYGAKCSATVLAQLRNLQTWILGRNNSNIITFICADALKSKRKKDKNTKSHCAPSVCPRIRDILQNQCLSAVVLLFLRGHSLTFIIAKVIQATLCKNCRLCRHLRGRVAVPHPFFPFSSTLLRERGSCPVPASVLGSGAGPAAWRGSGVWCCPHGS